jgi:hypothetical protein
MASSGDDSNNDNQSSSWWGSLIKSAKEKVYIIFLTYFISIQTVK